MFSFDVIKFLSAKIYAVTGKCKKLYITEIISDFALCRFLWDFAVQNNTVYIVK